MYDKGPIKHALYRQLPSKMLPPPGHPPRRPAPAIQPGQLCSLYTLCLQGKTINPYLAPPSKHYHSALFAPRSQLSVQRVNILDTNAPVTIFTHSHRHLGLDDGINTADLVGDFPRALEQQGLVDGTRHVGFGRAVTVGLMRMREGLVGQVCHSRWCAAVAMQRDG